MAATLVHNTSQSPLSIPELGISNLAPGGKAIVNQTAAQIKAAVTSVKNVGLTQTCTLTEQPANHNTNWQFNDPHLVQLLDAGNARR